MNLRGTKRARVSKALLVKLIPQRISLLSQFLGEWKAATAEENIAGTHDDPTKTRRRRQRQGERERDKERDREREP
jgi:hypothetical protein